VPVLWPYLLPTQAPARLLVAAVDSGSRVDQSDSLVVASFAASHHYRALARLLKACAGLLRQGSGLPKSAFRVAVNSDLPEKKLAVLGGLGFIGRSSLLVSRRFGPACLIGLLVLPAELLSPGGLSPEMLASGGATSGETGLADQLLAELTPGAGCGACRACQAACPTQAIGDHGYQRPRCLQHWSGRQGCPADIAAQRGSRLYGCDACIVACPYSAGRSPEEALAAEARLLPVERRSGRLVSADWLAGAAPEEVKAFFRGTALGFSWLPTAWLQDQARRFLERKVGARPAGGY